MALASALEQMASLGAIVAQISNRALYVIGACIALVAALVAVGAGVFALKQGMENAAYDAGSDVANWQAAGYTTELMVNAGETIIDATMAAFPNQNVVLPIGRGAGDLDPTLDYLSETVVDYATTTYGRFITSRFNSRCNHSDPSIILVP